MLISEVFYSLQSEGIFVGRPCVFIRAAGCNLRCAWCDTPYTSWSPRGETKTVEQLMAATESWRDVKHVAVTGGEPMLQKDLAQLVDALRARGHFVAIETAGTIYHDNIKPDFFSISPKLHNSFPGKEHDRELKIHRSNNTFAQLPRFIDSGIDYQFKFVVQSASDGEELLSLISEFRIDREKVFLVPEGISVEQLKSRAQMVADICKKEGLAYSARLQIDLWGNTRAT
jgi:7-carboxy-7-deazaguanine synthase